MLPSDEKETGFPARNWLCGSTGHPQPQVGSNKPEGKAGGGQICKEIDPELNGHTTISSRASATKEWHNNDTT